MLQRRHLHVVTCTCKYYASWGSTVEPQAVGGQQPHLRFSLAPGRERHRPAHNRHNPSWRPHDSARSTQRGLFTPKAPPSTGARDDRALGPDTTTAMDAKLTLFGPSCEASAIMFLNLGSDSESKACYASAPERHGNVSAAARGNRASRACWLHPQAGAPHPSHQSVTYNTCCLATALWENAW